MFRFYEFYLDFKTDDAIEANGGLHVIITYLPPNARVEAQAEGRTARAGHAGSYQFILHDPSVQINADPDLELQRLKIRRDELECRRLEKIRTEGVEKIRIEEEFLNRYHDEICSTYKNYDIEGTMNGFFNRHIFHYLVQSNSVITESWLKGSN